MPSDLDDTGLRRSYEHTELLVRKLQLGPLWNNYGLVGDIVVSTGALIFYSISISLSLV